MGTQPAATGKRPRGAPTGNQNAVKHGFYSRTIKPDELRDLLTYNDELSIADEIAVARVGLRRCLDYMTKADTQADDEKRLTPDEFAKLLGLALQATRTIARLLRDKRAISGESADSISSAIATALDALGDEFGLDL